MKNLMPTNFKIYMKWTHFLENPTFKIDTKRNKESASPLYIKQIALLIKVIPIRKLKNRMVRSIKHSRKK